MRLTQPCQTVTSTGSRKTKSVIEITRTNSFAMGSALHLLKGIDEETMNIVYGYVRVCDGKPFDIPSAIVDIILLYFNTKILESNYNEQNYNEFDDFDLMPLTEQLLRGIYSYGFEKPSLLQRRGIIPIINRRDTIIQSQSGTGKTATFAIAATQIINFNENKCQVLILEPTRELAQQTNKVVCWMATYIAYGGKHSACTDDKLYTYEEIIENCSDVQTIVGTPGSVHYMVSNGFISLNSVTLFVLNEVDLLLSEELGFKKEICDLRNEYMPSDIQIVISSTTMPSQILKIAAECMINPVRILVKNEELLLEGIKQFKVDVEKEKYKLETLIELYEQLLVTQLIIYCNSKEKVMFVTNKMLQNDFTVTAYHEGMSECERDLIMREFRSGSLRVLITTDILARGIDAHNISKIINYDLPENVHTYVHRIGRSGRYGRLGKSISFVCDEDKAMIKEIETRYCTVIDDLPADIHDF
eukprot:272518_1